MTPIYKKSMDRELMLGRRTIALAYLVSALGGACASAAPRSPEALRDAYLEAVARDDAEAAYALLSTELRAELEFDVFEQRWRSQRAERRAQFETPPTAAQSPVVWHGHTTHDGDVVLRWTWIGGRPLLIAGLSGSDHATTPAQAIRSFIAALQATDFTRVRALLAPELVVAFEADWQERAEALASALSQPEALVLSDDFARAELSYGGGRTLTLAQSLHGWRITGLE